MNAPLTSPSGHSADVRIHLYVNGRVLPVAQLGPKFLILRTPVDHPPCDAEIVMSIDGHESRWAVHLTDGIQSGRRKTAIASHVAHNSTAQPHQIGRDPKVVENGQSAMPA